MDFFELIRRRRSVRGFLVQPLEKEKVRAILEAANAAPSAGNLQAYEIYVVDRPAACARLAGVLPSMEFFNDAPVSLVFCASPDRSAPKYAERGRTLYAVQDATIACAFAMLAAEALGLGCVWVGAFDEGRVAEALNLPRTHRPVAILPVGYPAEIPEARPRRPLDEITHAVH
jgi:nitroreductase